MHIFSSDEMSEVQRLTRSGDPASATALIQSVLSRTGAFDAISGAPHPRQAPHQRPPTATSSVDNLRVLNPEVCMPDKAVQVEEEAQASNDAEASPVPRQAQATHAGTDAKSLPQGEFLDGLYPGVERPLHYKLFKPACKNVESAPLLVMLHGCTQDAQDFATGTAMNAIAQEAGLYVLYPTQAASSNMNRCWNWFEPSHQTRDQGEPALLSGLTRQIIKDYHIDTDRVFIAGLSAGGAMALVMAEEYPELFAAVGVHSGLPTGVASSMPDALSAMRSPSSSGASSLNLSGLSHGLSSELPFRGFSPLDGQATPKTRRHGSPVPTIVFHGDRDHTVSPANADRIVGDWLARNTDDRANDQWESTSESVRLPSGYGYTVTRYGRGNETRQIGCEHWSLERAGHRWSGGNSAGSHTDAQGPDASAEMVRFFLSVKPA